ncbi:MAG TPA: potassium-transporting ATPase subunit C [Acidimicrobiales bacterium]|nr:potassium-transporting ATPase subunit C [Acidimicrobiales bacterium]
MRRQLLPALGMLIVFTIITGGLYPLLVTGVAQAAFKDKANGSLVKVNGHVVGSKWIGQPFSAPKYFHPRPAADGYVPGAQGGGTASYGSNFGPLEPRLVGFVPGVNTVTLTGKPSKTNPFATADDPFCVPTDTDGNAIFAPSGGEKYAKNKDGSYVCSTDTIPERVTAYRAENNLDASVDVPVDAVTASGSGLDPEISVANARLQAPRVATERGMAVADVLKLVKKYTQGRGLGFLGERGVNVLQLNIALDKA